MKNVQMITYAVLIGCFLTGCGSIGQNDSTTEKNTQNVGGNNTATVRTSGTEKPDVPNAANSEKDKAKTSISSAYTDFKTNCKSGEIAEAGITCRGVGNYQIYFNDSAIDYVIEAQTTDGKVSIELAHQPFDSDFQNRKIEWRLAKGKPFAIILRVDEYVEENDGLTTKKTSGQNLIIKGLKGFENIDFKVNIRKTRNANKKARDLADSAFAKSGDK